MNLPDYSTRFDQLSFSSCYIELHGPGNFGHHATGFFWKHEKEIYLVTNWHVLTGKDIFTGEFTEKGWCAEALTVHFLTRDSARQQPAANSQILFNVKKHRFPLHREYHEPLWLQHQRTFDLNIDIAMLRLDAEVVSSIPNIVCMNGYGFEKQFSVPGSEIFIIGHPLSSKTSKYPLTFPIWKRGSIASELLVPWNMRPAFLVDTRTSAGMSGSPVIRRTFGPAVKGDLSLSLNNAVCSEFMGVYSGRLYDDENAASIGIVWHRNLIDEIIQNPAVGCRDWVESTVKGFEKV